MFTYLRHLIRKINAIKDYDWRWVPPPNWRSSRGGRDYW